LGGQHFWLIPGRPKRATGLTLLRSSPKKNIVSKKNGMRTAGAMLGSLNVSRGSDKRNGKPNTGNGAGGKKTCPVIRGHQGTGRSVKQSKTDRGDRRVIENPTGEENWNEKRNGSSTEQKNKKLIKLKPGIGKCGFLCQSLWGVGGGLLHYLVNEGVRRRGNSEVCRGGPSPETCCDRAIVRGKEKVGKNKLKSW